MARLEPIWSDISSNVYKFRSLWTDKAHTDVIPLQVLYNILKLHLPMDSVNRIMHKSVCYAEWSDKSEEVVCISMLTALINKELGVIA